MFHMKHLDIAKASLKLNLFAENFIKWQRKINLTAHHEDLWQRHIAQSIALLDFFPQDISGSIDGISRDFLSVADFGTGAGFPGLIAAIIQQENHIKPYDIQFHLVESDQKKAAFVREMARLTQTKIHLHICRIENLPPQKFDIITARALTNLTDLCHYAENYIHQNSIGLFYKGKNCHNELTEALKSWHINYKVIPLSQQDSFLIQCKEISRAK